MIEEQDLLYERTESDLNEEQDLHKQKNRSCRYIGKRQLLFSDQDFVLLQDFALFLDPFLFQESFFISGFRFISGIR